MDCKLVSSKLVRYLDEDLPAQVFEEITAHLDQCYLCAEEYHELVSVTDLARQNLRCGAYTDGYDRLRAQLKLETEPDNVVYLPPRLQALKTALNITAVAVAVLLFVAGVGLPAVETMRAIGETIDAQAGGRGPIIEPCRAQGPSLVAWSGQIRWAESLAFGAEPRAKENATTEQPAQQTDGCDEAPTPSAALLRPFSPRDVIVLL